MSEPTTQAPPPPQRILNLKRHLPCRLTDDERLARGIELARLSEDIGNEEKRQTDLKAEMKARLSALESQAAEIASIVRRNEEHRDVVVQEIYDYPRKVVLQVRTDTGEQIHRRDMTAAEMQEALPFEAEA